MLDLRPYKQALRTECIEKRKKLSQSEKKDYDIRIANKLFNTWCYRECDKVFAYASKDIEVDTFEIIEKALKSGKKVALPYCVSGTRNMEFYYINSLSDLKVGSYCVMEPDINVCEKAVADKNSICIVPALSFDLKGYRLGYGGGYYDRFLKNFPGITLGICYDICIKNEGLLYGKYDRTVKYVITENRFISAEK